MIKGHSRSRRQRLRLVLNGVAALVRRFSLILTPRICTLTLTV